VSDLRVAVRALMRAPMSSFVAVATLAVGIASIATMMTIVNAILLRKLPYAEPDRLVMVWPEKQDVGWVRERMSFPELREWEQSGIFQQVVGFVPVMLTITRPGEPERVHGHAATTGLLSLLGVKPLLGRAFSAEEDGPNSSSAVILGYSFWKRRYAGDRDIIGKTIDFDGLPHLVVGVMPPEFQFFNRQSDVLFTINHKPESFGRRRFLRAIARLKPGSGLEEAQQQVNGVAAHLAREYPQFNAGWSARLVSLPDDAAGELRAPLLALLGAAALVLVIACSNVVSLLLVQVNDRARDLALRLALGADRWRIVRQVLTESSLLAAAGAVPGLLLAYVAVQFFRDTLPERFGAGRYLIQLDQIQFDGRALLMAAAFVPLSALAVGLLPAVRASRAGLTELLKDAARGGSQSRGTRRIHRAVMALQIAVAVLLVIGASLLVQTFAALYRRGPGFRADNMVTVSLQLPLFQRRTLPPEQRREWIKRTQESVLERIAALPGIDAAASVNDLPLRGFYWLNPLTIERRVERDVNDVPQAVDRYVSPGYFATLGIPVIQGRYFGPLEDERQSLASIVNEAFVRKYLTDGVVLGRRVSRRTVVNLAQPEAAKADAATPWYTVVGVVADEPLGGVEEPPRPIIYFSTAQHPQDAFNLVVRSRLAPSAALAATTAELKRIDPMIAPYGPTTFDTLVLDSTWRVRYAMLLLGGLALVSLVMALAGIYSVMTYAVTRRTGEIGVRMALGARRGAVLRMVLSETMALAAIGVLIGLAAAAGLARFLSNLLFGVTAFHLPTYAAVTLLVFGIAVLASVLPARRAASVDPLCALRTE